MPPAPAPALALDEATVRALLAGAPLGEFALERVDAVPAEAAARLVLAAAGQPSLELELRARDDARERAYATRRFNVLAHAEGRLARPHERLLKAVVAHLRAHEKVLPRVATAPPVWDGRIEPVRAATAALLGELAALARIPPAQPVWAWLAKRIATPAAAKAQAGAAARGGLAFDLALSARGRSWRAGITLNRRVVRDLAALADSLLATAPYPREAATILVGSVGWQPGVEVTVGATASGADAKLKFYAQEREQGSSPVRQRDVRRLAEACKARALLRVVPARVAVACVDAYPDGKSALKVYTGEPPASWPERSLRAAARFADDARAAGGHVYHTLRAEAGRAPAAVNVVFGQQTAGQRAEARRFATAALRGRPIARRLDELQRAAGAAGAELAVTALGLDLDGEERDVYFVPA